MIPEMSSLGTVQYTAGHPILRWQWI